MNLKKILAAAAASVMAVSTMAVAANAFTAGLTYQTSKYGFRDSIAQTNGIWWDEFEEAQTPEVSVFNDVDFTTDGTYTVSFKKSNEDEGTSWNMIKLQTNIPSADYADVKINIDSVKIDGAAVSFTGDTAFDIEAAENLEYNQYADGANGITAKVPNAYGASIVNVYGNSIIDNVYGGEVEVTFTISGLGSGNAGDGTANDNNTVGDTTTTTTDKTSADTGVEGVAVVAGIAVLAAGAIVVAKKRK